MPSIRSGVEPCPLLSPGSESQDNAVVVNPEVPSCAIHPLKKTQACFWTVRPPAAVQYLSQETRLLFGSTLHLSRRTNVLGGSGWHREFDYDEYGQMSIDRNHIQPPVPHPFLQSNEQYNPNPQGGGSCLMHYKPQLSGQCKGLAQEPSVECSDILPGRSGGNVIYLSEDPRIGISDDGNHSTLYIGPSPTPPMSFGRLLNTLGPLSFPYPPLCGGSTASAELRLWNIQEDRIISQNSSQRRVNRAVWLSACDPHRSYPAALKYVYDGNARDGRSIKREIECHLYLYQRLRRIVTRENYIRDEDAWPCAELFGYHLDKKEPGKCVMITRMLSGPDFFDLIRCEHEGVRNECSITYSLHKLQWSYLALKRIAQLNYLGVRHNDLKPDNIMLDRYTDGDVEMLDVKIIDLGTASMEHATDFTGGTTWYESPEQKMLEYHTKKRKDPVMAKTVEIDISSDAWGAGLSIAELLMGRRLVDAFKPPLGPGPLEYRGANQGWAVEPDIWVKTARRALRLHEINQPLPLCAQAAKYLFDALVLPNRKERATVADMKEGILQLIEEARLQLQIKSNQLKAKGNGNVQQNM